MKNDEDVGESESNESDSASLMDQRAALLAQPIEPDESQEPGIEVLSFHIGEQSFAIESRFIIQVYRTNSITRISGVEVFLAGVTNFQGTVLTLIDLGPVFEVPATERAASQDADDDRSFIAVVGKGEAEFGITIDQPGQVFRIKLSDLLPLPAGMPTMAAAVASAIAPTGGLLLDGGSLLSDQRFVIDQRD